jgi:mRNA deadenylase 3'-5' endonuclease subunit Ccr4
MKKYVFYHLIRMTDYSIITNNVGGFSNPKPVFDYKEMLSYSADIYCFQELVDSKEELQNIRDAFETEGYRWFEHERQKSKKIEEKYDGYGLVICLSNKISKMISIYHHSRALVVFLEDCYIVNLHLPARSPKEQKLHICSILKKYNNTTTVPCMLIGDFNSEPDSELYNFIIESEFVSDYKRIIKREPLTRNDKTLDFIFGKNMYNQRVLSNPQ